MRSILILCGIMLFSSHTAFSEPVDSASGQEEKPTISSTEKPVCLLSGMPPSDVKYTVIRRIKVGKQTYGDVNEVVPRLVKKARVLGADAVIGYVGSQRFGFWPWRMVRPVARGTAVTWSLPSTVTCEGIGGTYETKLHGSLTSDKPIETEEITTAVQPDS